MALKNRAGHTERTFLGHPRGLSTLFMTEMWERFSYYGMKAILLYYMYYEAAHGGLGMDKSLAKSLVSVYGAALYMSGIAGGWLSDRLLGARRSIAGGAVLIMFAHITLAIPGGGAPALYVSMILLVLGTGLLKPNITKGVGDLYEKGDNRRDAGFTLFVMGVQIGAFLAPIIVGNILTKPSQDDPTGNHFHLGFGAAAIGMALGLAQYLLRAKKTMGDAGTHIPNPIEPESRTRVFGTALGGLAVLALVVVVLAMTGTLSAEGVVNAISVISLVLPLIYFVVMLKSSKVTAQERGQVVAYIPLFLAMVVFWFIEEQQAGVMAQYADQQTALDAWGFHIDPTLAQSVNPVMMLIFSPVVAVLWTKLRRQPSTPQKFSVGLVLTGLGFAILFLPWVLHGADAKVDPIWPLLSLATIAVGELFVNPVSLSATTQLAPAAFAAQVVGLNYAANAAGQGLIAQASKEYDAASSGPYFGIFGVIAMAVGVGLWFYSPAIQRRMVGKNQSES
ncbi:peptide MFS transporter [Amycolatopsis sp. CA-230715]|uniref:peptide MFS transporter n=1 Tax=Amycolatopsis sp. CA-230715 TaxID=2745196 RepID=UPI0020B2D09B|nr:oligopeptide:H+ symporter [Amycolatopsis sp. CA-230715]